MKLEQGLAAMAGMEILSLRVLGEGTSMKTYCPFGGPRMLTASPERTGLVDLGCTKNSPPRRHAKNAMQEAVAHVRSSKDKRDNVHAFPHTSESACVEKAGFFASH